jgi:GTP-binding protein
MRTRLLLHIVDMLPIEGEPHEHATIIANELEKFSPTLAQHERWLVLNKIDLLPEEEREEKVQAVIKALGWTGPVYAVSSITGAGTDALCYDILEHVEKSRKELEDPEVEEIYHERLRQIQLEGRESIRRVADLRRMSADDDEDDDYDDDDYDVDVVYTRE